MLSCLIARGISFAVLYRMLSVSWVFVDVDGIKIGALLFFGGGVLVFWRNAVAFWRGTLAFWRGPLVCLARGL